MSGQTPSLYKTHILIIVNTCGNTCEAKLASVYMSACNGMDNAVTGSAETWTSYLAQIYKMHHFSCVIRVHEALRCPSSTSILSAYFGSQRDHPALLLIQTHSESVETPTELASQHVFCGTIHDKAIHQPTLHHGHWRAN